ncbi:MAG: sulfide/dihydroorotate dehydrogenase-like FAD/NAD-binding protein [Clostridia bacterium]|nr:sulfide/dihydroorotate dehydrogenase-like FAD/NAD-binding protein [Clostridia bacterium]
MNKILEKRVLTPEVVLMKIYAPRIAKKAEPGQFIIVMPTEKSERIPLTIADYEREAGSVTIIFQTVGATTMLLGEMNEGDEVYAFAGPLGKPSLAEGIKKVAVIGGGLGCAIAYPQAKKLHAMGAEVDMIAGFRTKDIVILEDEMRAASSRLFVMTDDGSNGNKGFVTNKLEELLAAGEKYDEVIAIGPLMMMKFVCKLTEKYGIKTTVSMNPIMIDGTGMCGGCRLTVGGETKFACVDGPDFDGHLVDFDEVIRRAGMYKKEEQGAREAHCNLFKQKGE